MRVVTAAVICRNGKILITQRPEGKAHAGFWEFPGGKLEDGEDPIASLHREIEEEIGVRIRIGEIIEVVHHVYHNGTFLILAYLCELIEGEIRHLEVADHCWIDPEQASQYNLLPADQPIIDAVVRRVLPLNR